MTILLIMYTDINIKLYKYKLKNMIAFVITPFASSEKFLKKEFYSNMLLPKSLKLNRKF